MHLNFKDLNESNQKAALKLIRKKARAGDETNKEILEGIKQGEEVIIGTMNDDREDWLVVHE